MVRERERGAGVSRFPFYIISEVINAGLVSYILQLRSGRLNFSECITELLFSLPLKHFDIFCAGISNKTPFGNVAYQDEFVGCNV
jgi:hypothetical protein